MAEREWSGRSTRDGRQRSARLAELSDLALVDAMRTGDEGAFEEFVCRFQLPVLLQARRLRVRPEERRQWVIDALYQAGTALCRRKAPPYGSVIAYLVTACKRKSLTDRRRRDVRERREIQCADDTSSGEGAVLSLCSEATVRAAYGADREQDELPPVLAWLVSMLCEATGEDDRRLLAWVGQRISYSEIAGWLGINRSAAIKRVTRLRARLGGATLRFARSLERRDRAELLRFLRRAKALDEPALRALESAPYPARRASGDDEESRRTSAKTQGGSNDTA